MKPWKYGTYTLLKPSFRDPSVVLLGQLVQHGRPLVCHQRKLPNRTLGPMFEKKS
jgi:hypothetical protein